MRIVVPFTDLRVETEAAIAAHTTPDASVTLVDVSSDDEALWRLWRGLWAAGETFVVVEHDIVVHRHVLFEFAACPQLWCTFGYPYDAAADGRLEVYHGTGCCRFRAELLAEHPDAVEAAGRIENDQHPPRHWCTLDAFVQVVLHQRGVYAHRHEPPVGHLDTRRSHGCHA